MKPSGILFCGEASCGWMEDGAGTSESWAVVEGRRYKNPPARPCELCGEQATRIVDVMNGDELFEFYVLCDGEKCIATIRENAGV
jgi:hypothetical protein